MFKVLCVKASTRSLDCKGRVVEDSGWNVVVGNFYTVIKDEYYIDGVYYHLSESKSPNEIFISTLFTIVSDIDEMELVNKKEETYA
jgi:hypothetical protein